MTIAQIINIWPIAQYLAANEIQNRRNNSGAVDVNLPTKIYSIGTAVQRIYDSDPTDDTLPATARYLYALCGKYGLQASVVTEEAGTVSPVTPVTLPQPIDWIVAATASATAVLADGEGSVMLDGTNSMPDLRGYNLMFTRNSFPQYTTDPGDGSFYYGWNRSTGLFELFNGDAATGERMRIDPIS